MDATPTSTLRYWWGNYRCRRGGTWSQPLFFGAKIGYVPTVSTPAYLALETCLKATGYKPYNSWSYSCRPIAGTNQWSLHSYGIAIDIDPNSNPFTYGDPFGGRFKPHHIEAVEAMRNVRGDMLWSWGGRWPKRDRMHFQLNVSPSGAVVDWRTVAGAIVTEEPKVATYKGVINIPEADLPWARAIIDRRIASGLIIISDKHQDDWKRDGRLWTFFDRALRPIEGRLARLEQ